MNPIDQATPLRDSPQIPLVPVIIGSRVNRPASKTIIVIMNPSLTLCWNLGVWNAIIAIAPPSPRPRPIGT